MRQLRFLVSGLRFRSLYCAIAVRQQAHFEGNASVVTIVLALAVANLGLGIALAVALDRFSVSPRSHTWQGARGSALVIPKASGNDDGSSPNSSEDKQSKMLLDAEIAPKSIIERLLWIVKLETSARREQLIELDRVFFAPDSPQSIDSELKLELEFFHQLLESWIAEAHAEKEQPGQLCEALEELLLDQAVRLRACIDGLVEASRDGVARQLAAAINAVNLLRNQTDAFLCQLLTTEDRWHCVPDRLRTFGERDTLTHLGLAALFDEWWAADPDRVRLVSVVMLDLDQFDSFNCQVGAARGDDALRRLDDLLHDLARKDRGFDRVARYSGQRFVLFLGDTSLKNAAKVAERSRQTIEAATFNIGEVTRLLTASVAVIEVGKTEKPREFVPRLEATLNECKKAGRNESLRSPLGDDHACESCQIL